MANSRSKREKTATARNRVLKFAREHGVITNRQARRAMGIPQVWYHLDVLTKIGVLKREDYNTWVPVKRRGRQKLM